MTDFLQLSAFRGLSTWDMIVFIGLVFCSVFVDYGESPGCRRNSNSVIPSSRCRGFACLLLFKIHGFTRHFMRGGFQPLSIRIDLVITEGGRNGTLYG